MRRHSIPLVLALMMGLVLPSGLSTASLDAPGITVRIDPSKTWVGLARVHLEVTDLMLRGTELEGRYRIRVPLFPFKNDTGTIRLWTQDLLEPEREVGSTIDGSAHSDSGIDREVHCTLESGRSINIEITMDDRVVTFRTKYQRL